MSIVICTVWHSITSPHSKRIGLVRQPQILKMCQVPVMPISVHWQIVSIPCVTMVCNKVTQGDEMLLFPFFGILVVSVSNEQFQHPEKYIFIWLYNWNDNIQHLTSFPWRLDLVMENVFTSTDQLESGYMMSSQPEKRAENGATFVCWSVSWPWQLLQHFLLVLSFVFTPAPGSPGSPGAPGSPGSPGSPSLYSSSYVLSPSKVTLLVGL